ncbi:MAG: inactive transglutaminase family protein, partial [Porticoccaceae bacterium]|nr:inactive transglutaminase family protein [Porticoccaceae bacterium]
MHSSRIQLIVVAGLLIVAGVGLTLYKAVELGFPLWPGENRKVWTLESKITFTPGEGPVEVSLALPQAQGGWKLLDENFASAGFGFSVQQIGNQRRAVWSRRSLDEKTTLYYKLQLYREQAQALSNASPADTELPSLPKRRQQVVDQLVASVTEKSVDNASFARLLMTEFSSSKPSQEVTFLLSEHKRKALPAMEEVFAVAAIPTQRIKGVYLENGRRRQQVSELLEVYLGDQWLPFDPETGIVGLAENFFVWQRGVGSTLDVMGGNRSRLEFAMVANSLPAKTVLLMEPEVVSAPLLDFSIYALPVEQQGVFKNILLVPIGAFLVVLLRVFVGLRTAGTFMPILIALAFIQTTLLTGLWIFLVVVSIGLWIRSYLSHLNLLLVARVSAVVVVVVLLMAAFSIVSYKLGIDQALTVTFFPTIILSWTIERMSVLWEEEGGHEVFIQGSGSLVVAVATYLAVTNRYIEHLTFNFPELMLSLLGVILVLGQYSGYRLSEL